MPSKHYWGMLEYFGSLWVQGCRQRPVVNLIITKTAQQSSQNADMSRHVNTAGRSGSSASEACSTTGCPRSYCLGVQGPPKKPAGKEQPRRLCELCAASLHGGHSLPGRLRQPLLCTTRRCSRQGCSASGIACFMQHGLPGLTRQPAGPPSATR